MTEVRIVHGGTPTDEELAAIVAVLAARAAERPREADQSLRRPLSRWVASGRVKGTRTKV